MEQFDHALVCLAVRNRVVHGLPMPDLAPTLERLRSLTQELLAEWATSGSTP
ncbi:MAG: hypothetical protein OHK0012_09720 [Synechococcales cyanobacterium]